jgi:hypothetical protein
MPDKGKRKPETPASKTEQNGTNLNRSFICNTLQVSILIDFCYLLIVTNTKAKKDELGPN